MYWPSLPNLLTEPAPHIYVIFLLIGGDSLISEASTEVVKQLPIQVLRRLKKKKIKEMKSVTRALPHGPTIIPWSNP